MLLFLVFVTLPQIAWPNGSTEMTLPILYAYANFFVKTEAGTHMDWSS